MIKRGNKKAYEFSFAWIFTVFAGAVILFFAIYASTQLVDTKRAESEAKAGKTLGILLTPVETNLEEARASTILVKDETRIFNDCGSYPSSSNNYFGSQRISASIKSSIGQEWNAIPGAENTFHNKYLFSNGIRDEDKNLYTQGNKEFYLFSKPLEFPFKVADLVMLWSDKQHYCFVTTAPEFIDDLEDLGLTEKNIEIVTSGDPDDCKEVEGLKKVCFDSAIDPSCEIEVNSGIQRVIHKTAPSNPVYYEVSSDSFDPFPLLYAAIFSDPKIYQCQIERLGKRAEMLAELHKEKLSSLVVLGCSPGQDPLQSALSSYMSLAENLNDQSLNNLNTQADQVKDKNDERECKIF